MDKVTLVCFFSSYAVAFALELSQLVRESRLARWIAIGFTAAGVVAHTAYLLVRSRDAQLPPLLSSGHDWMLVLTWLAVVVSLSIVLWDQRQAIGLFVLPPVLLLVGAARFAGMDASALQPEMYWLNMLHATFLVLGGAGCVAGLVLSAMYLVQHRRLRTRLVESDELRLFSLERLGRWNWWAIVISIPMLTLGMALGLVLVYRSRDTAEAIHLGQTSFAVIGVVWLLSAVLLGWLLASRQAAGRLVAWRTAWTCGLMLLTLLILQVFSQGGVHGNTDRQPQKAELVEPVVGQLVSASTGRRR